MRTLFFSTITLFITLTAIFLFQKGNNDSKRDHYESFLHQQFRNFSENLQGKNAKTDNPEWAAFQNYIMTLDPALGRVPTERLYHAFLQKQKITKIIPQTKTLNWQNIPSNMGGRTRALMWDPNDPQGKKVWAGSVTGGLWYNNDITDSLSQWVSVSDFWDNLSISAIVADPNNPQTFYVGTGEAQTAIFIYRESSGRGSGIWKTIDGGNTFTHLDSTTNFAYVTDLVVRDENGNSVIYAGVMSGTYHGEVHQAIPTDGLYRSSDGGITWNQVLPNIPSETVPYAVSDIEIAANGRIFVGTSANLNGVGASTILYSDLGTAGSWTVFSNYNTSIPLDPIYNIPGRIILASAPSDSNIVYALIAAGTLTQTSEGFGTYIGKYILKTTNGGNSWTEMPIPPDNSYGNWATIPWHAMDAAVDPNNPNRIFIGGLDLYLSENGGNSWNQVSDWVLMYYGGGPNYVHADQHKALFKPGSSSEIIFGCDGGVFYSNNANVSTPVFRERNYYYSTLQFYTCAIGQNTDYLGGAQDNGTLLYQGQPLYHANDMYSGGDGAFCFFDPDENIVITSYYDNQYYAFYNSNYNAINSYYCGLFVNPVDYDGINNVLYANAMDVQGNYQDQLVRITGLPDNDNGIFLDLNTGSTVPYSNITLSPNTPDVLFIGTQAGRLFKVTNISTTPIATEIGSNLFPTANISGIAVGSNDNTLLISFSNYGVQKIWQTTDGGTNWIDKTGNLPDIPVRWVIFHPQNNEQAMIATELGVWTTNELAQTITNWYPSTNGPANVRTDMLRIRTSDNTVLAATHGRNFFTTTFAYNPYVSNETKNFNNALSIYPNPAQEFITINSPDNIQSIKIISIKGTMVKSISTINSKQIRLNVSELESGIYFVETITKNHKKLITKLIKN